ncbi:MAG: hypothetical protein COV44_11915 [Deltaproteobacteria bacterium CG11_big_fil_rev_8_21_14_0_20_45_16]|nr:MAG: hypothetical protein COV44_11915 [Deltaproteobacteria bacterium CG11_big_fil_rev_8_21_14_0_20_45_16]
MSDKTGRIYRLAVWFNGYRFKEVIVDPHYEQKHQGSIDDELILELIRIYVNREEILPGSVKGEYSYFALHLVHQLKSYRLVFCTAEDLDQFIVINCFRTKGMKSL